MASINQSIGLIDKVSPTLSKIEQQALANVKAYERLSKANMELSDEMERLDKAGLRNTEMFNQLAEVGAKYTDEMEAYANGTKNADLETKSLSSSLPSIITSLIGMRAVLGGIKSLINMSGEYTQTTARLNMMNDGLQTTAELQDMIYQSAQNSRVAYQSMADIVSKLGTQAGDAFNNNSKQVIAFSELLNKLFTTQGMDSTAISSTMYNMTQSLSTGKLLGQDYRILKQNAPQMIKYLQDFYQVNAAGLDEMVSKGQVTAQGIKSAIFSATDDINSKFNEMPVTFSQAWTKFSNTIQKMLTPILNVLSNMMQAVDGLFTFLSEHQYILWLVAAGITAILAPILLYNTYTAISTLMTNLLNTSMGKLLVKFALITAGILIVVGVLMYLWNTNDDVAYGMLFAWDMLEIGVRTVAIAIKSIVYGLASIFERSLSIILYLIQDFAQLALAPINLVLSGLQALGADVKPIELSFANDFEKDLNTRIKARDAELGNDWAYIANRSQELNATREKRVAERQKIGYAPNNIENVLEDYANYINEVTDTDSTGSKALRVTTNDNLLSDDDVQLLLDVATRDYKLNYQQITPNITLTFGDIRETADVDNIIDEVADRLEEIYDANLEVAYNG